MPGSPRISDGWPDARHVSSAPCRGFVDESYGPARTLRVSLEAGPGAAVRDAFFRNLPKDQDALSFWLLIAVKLSKQEPWWYDTLAGLVRRYLRSREWQEQRKRPEVLVNWCAGVAAGEIKRPGGRGRPAKYMRDALICAA